MDKTDDNADRFQITELFMAKADVNRCFYGCIKRLKDKDGNSFVFSRIVMPDGLLCASAPEKKELGENLDEIVIMILDKGLHDNSGLTINIFGTKYFYN